MNSTEHANIRVALPQFLRMLTKTGPEITLAVPHPATMNHLFDALEAAYPALAGTVRDHYTKRRRPYLRFYACLKDLSHEQLDSPLPDAVVRGEEPFLVIGAISGG